MEKKFAESLPRSSKSRSNTHTHTPEGWTEPVVAKKKGKKGHTKRFAATVQSSCERKQPKCATEEAFQFSKVLLLLLRPGAAVNRNSRAKVQLFRTDLRPPPRQSRDQPTELRLSSWRGPLRTRFIHTSQGQERYRFAFSDYNTIT